MESTKAEDFRALNILAFSMMAGLALFAAITTYLVTSGAAPASGAILSPQGDVLAVAVFGLVCLTMSRFLAGKLLGSVTDEERQNYSAAMLRYRSAIILRLALLEGAGLLGTVFALLTGNLNLLLVSLFMLAMMWLGRPSETEFAEWRS